MSSGGLGPEPILAGLCLVKAWKLILKQPALSLQPKPRGALDRSWKAAQGDPSGFLLFLAEGMAVQRARRASSKSHQPVGSSAKAGFHFSPVVPQGQLITTDNSCVPPLFAEMIQEANVLVIWHLSLPLLEPLVPMSSYPASP